MAFPELHFFAANDINGATILELPITDGSVESVAVRVALREIGSMDLRLSRQLAADLVDSSAFNADNAVRLLVPSVSAARYFALGFVGDQTRQLVARIAAGEDIAINLLGPAWYLSRAILWDTQFSVDADHPYRIDTQNNQFVFEGDADAGNVLKRLQREDNNNTIAEFIPDMTITFDHDVDSNGGAWADPVGSNEAPFTLPIGQTFLDDTMAVLAAVPSLDMTWDVGTVATPKLEMSVWQSLVGYGRDLVPASVNDFASDVVHFKKGKNIASDVVFRTAGRRKATHVLVIGSDAAYGHATRVSYSPGGYARAVAIERGNIHWEPALDRAGERFLAHQQAGEQEIALEHFPGFSPTTGRYMPGPHSTNGHYWLGDSIGLTTTASTADAVDLEAASELVTAITMQLATVAKDGTATEGALSWRTVAELNIERSSASAPSETSQGTTGSVGCRCLHFAPQCQADPVDVEVIDWDWSACSNPSFTDALSGTTGNPWGGGSVGDWDVGFCNTEVGKSVIGTSKKWAVTPGEILHVAITSAKYGAPSGTTVFQLRYYDSGGALLSSESHTFNRGYLSHEGSDHGTWVTDSADYTVPASAAYASVVQTVYTEFFVQHIAVTIAAAPITNDPYCVDYDATPSIDHGSPYVLPSDYVQGRLDDLQDQIGDRVPIESDTDPTVNDDSGDGYIVGQIWVNTTTDEAFVLVDNTTGAAVWDQIDNDATTSLGVTLQQTQINQRFPVWGHRGDIGSADAYPEESLEGLRQCALKGIQGAEIDVRLSSDSEWVLMHDSTVDRTTSSTGAVSSKTAATITGLTIDAGFGYDAGRHGSSIHPTTLAAVFDALNPYDFVLSIQLPSDISSDANATTLAQYVLDQGWAHRSLIEVSTLTAAAAIKAVSPLLTVEVNNTVSGADSDDNVDWLSMERATVTSLSVVTGKAPKHVKSYITINDFPADETSIIQDMWDRGVSAYQTDNVDFAIAARNALVYGGTSSVAAADVSITDSGAYYTGTDVEAALQEVGASLATLSSTPASGHDHDHIVDEQFSGDGSTTTFDLANEAIPETIIAYVGGTRTSVTVTGSMNDQMLFSVAPASGTLNVSVDYIAVAN